MIYIPGHSAGSKTWTQKSRMGKFHWQYDTEVL